MALRRDQGNSNRHLQGKLLFGAGPTIRLGLKRIERFREMDNRFDVRRSTDRDLACLTPVFDRLSVQTCMREMMSKDLGLARDRLGETFLEYGGNSGMQLVAAALEQALISCLLH